MFIKGEFVKGTNKYDALTCREQEIPTSISRGSSLVIYSL